MTIDQAVEIIDGVSKKTKNPWPSDRIRAVAERYVNGQPPELIGEGFIHAGLSKLEFRYDH